MSELPGVYRVPHVSLSTWNIAAENQKQRVGQIAEQLAKTGPGITILTELIEIEGLKKALTNELGQSFELSSVPTGSCYKDSVGLLVATPDCKITDDARRIDTGGKKMPYYMEAIVSTPLGAMTIAAMRGAYVSGKGGWLTSGSLERKEQYLTATILLSERDGISVIGGDMNSLPRTHDPIFGKAGYQRLTGQESTWPDKKGIKATTKDAQVIAAPFLLLGMGFSIDAIYGKGPIRSIGSEATATGLSDHLHLRTYLQANNGATSPA